MIQDNILYKQGSESLLGNVVHNINHIVNCSKKRIHYQHVLLPDLPNFINLIYQNCGLTPTILTIGLIYLNRLKKRLPEQSVGEYDTPYKLFLAAMIIATKYIEDGGVHSVLIYRYVSPVYSSKEVNEMERSFLGVLKFDLYVDIDEINEFTKAYNKSFELKSL